MVVAAWIAVDTSAATPAGTLIEQTRSRHVTLKQQREQLDTTLAAQNEQLDVLTSLDLGTGMAGYPLAWILVARHPFQWTKRRTPWTCPGRSGR